LSYLTKGFEGEEGTCEEVGLLVRSLPQGETKDHLSKVQRLTTKLKGNRMEMEEVEVEVLAHLEGEKKMSKMS
jgi:hypothetical protein